MVPGANPCWKAVAIQASISAGVVLGKVLIEEGLACRGQQDRKAFEGAEGAFLRRRRIMAGAQVGKLGRDLPVVLRTTKG
jgi:hypothetical protein